MRKNSIKRVTIKSQLLYCGCENFFSNGIVYPMRMPEGTLAIRASPCKYFATIHALLNDGDLKQCTFECNKDGTLKFVINNPALLVRLLSEKIIGYLYTFKSAGFEQNSLLDHRYYDLLRPEYYESVGLQNLPFKLTEGVLSYTLPLLIN